MITSAWHWIFLINLPISSLCVVVGVGLSDGRLKHRDDKGPIDGVGLALMFTWIAALQLMLDLGRERDWFGDPLIVALAVIAGIGFLVFLIWELTDEHPVVDLRVFRHPGFAFGVIAFSLSFGAYFASIVLSRSGCRAPWAILRGGRHSCCRNGHRRLLPGNWP